MCQLSNSFNSQGPGQACTGVALPSYNSQKKKLLHPEQNKETEILMEAVFVPVAQQVNIYK
jgi:hypothetical protein